MSEGEIYAGSWFINLDELVGDSGTLPRYEVATSAGRLSRPTETRACLKALVDQFSKSLSEVEQSVFVFRLTEHTPWEKLGEIVGQEGIHRIRQSIEGKALRIWQRPEPVYYNGQRKRRGVPEEIPQALLDVLTDQELVALVACQRGATQKEAGRYARLSQPTVSRIIAFVWESLGKPREEVTPRTWRYKNDQRREQVLAVFFSRPAGELVTYEELLEVFSDVKDPWGTMWTTVSRYSRQLEGARIVVVKGKGYVLVEAVERDPPAKRRKLRDGKISELTTPGAHAP